MKPIEQLITTQDPGWALVQEWISAATNPVEVLPADLARARSALLAVQVTTRSPMGAIIYESGGIFVDNGWIRLLGSGHPRLDRSIAEWNLGKSHRALNDPPSFLLVADDAVGGYFAINSGEFGEDVGQLYFMAPDTLQWEPMDLNYSQFLDFCFRGDLNEFYAGLRWKGWQEDVCALGGNRVFHTHPPLFTREGRNAATSSRKAVPVHEMYALTLHYRSTIVGIH